MASAYELVRVEDPSDGPPVHDVARSCGERRPDGPQGQEGRGFAGKALRALPRTTKGREPAPRPKAQPKTEEKDS